MREGESDEESQKTYLKQLLPYAFRGARMRT